MGLPEINRETGRPRILQVATIDLAIKKLMLPLMKELLKNGCHVDAAAADLGDGTPAYLESLGFNFHDIGIERSMSPGNILKAVKNIYRLLKNEKYDIVHLHTPVAAFTGRLAARLAGVPEIIYTAHGFYFHENMRLYKRLVFELAEFSAGRLATDYLFCQSIEDTDKALNTSFLSPSRILHIGNGVDTDLFAPDADIRSEIRKELGISIDSVVVSFIGRIVKEKGILDLIDSFIPLATAHKDLTLVITGDSTTAADRDSTTFEAVRKAIRSNDLDRRVILTGFRDDPERILAASDIFVLPSYREGLPRSICEAMSSGLPVIATAIRGCREQVDDGINGFLFPPGNIHLLRGAIEDLALHRGKRLIMGEKAREKALTIFREEDVIERQMKIYRHILQERLRRPIPVIPVIEKEKTGESIPV
ncbi:MAG: glycosyltransferase family 4 protein [Candidatus Krumholzibacteriota bacterium]|nr:glycosyltransferase family 4 protein [Candidatus Krumholzibacteriota bacterium]